MPKFLNNVSPDWGAHYTTCENCGGRYHKSEGYCCESEPELGKPDPYDGFRDQLDELHESKWVELYELMYETKCPKLLAFFEGLELVSDSE